MPRLPIGALRRRANRSSRFGPHGFSAVLRVPDDFPAVQPAIAAAFDRDTVDVTRGVYTLTEVTVEYGINICRVGLVVE